MGTKLVRIGIQNAEKLWKMQVNAFQDLYKKYQDTETSPATEGIDKIHSDWELDTILQEKGNCYLYEKLGYRQTGKTEKINDKLTLVFYRKE